MKCPACQTENAAEAKFCGNCGHSLTEEVVASSGQEEGPEQARAAQAKETRPNETVEQAKRFASGYFQFFKHAFKAPTAIMKNGKVEVRNGIVSLILICFLAACIFYRMMSAAAAVTRTFAPEISTPTFFLDTVTVFLFLLILTLFIGFIICVSGKMMKSSFSFLEVFGIWGTIATPAIAILVLSFLFSFLLIFFLPILLGLATTYMAISIIVAIVKLDNGGLDLVYTLFIANVLIGIATFIVLWSYISTIIQTITQGLTGF
ncbi:MULTISPECIES: zinc ribbon domain-containing protein [Bacillus]|uniref:Zinc ribbon domain-containing protein n=1 Tax=Bacillus wiedmannii TaxID=1890302 RepID=A0A2C4Z9U4_9BACI|nr:MULTISPECIES: zinc ribbon domain-containing protein [Bacillus]MDF9663416.1 zinc ribbon domain-containing protein [Bacillus wiedmannii]MDI6505843.1 zinc ribbon domain-containing protein [Bacillus wiedmannii]MDI6510532.1 zinc ribbon domain-containing protein [Bacillus wiedmannii]PFZ27582.1 zinc ribbon domain-containing protein [Bacillus wiedmannii]PGC22688.1 zinc ribbon domain-containing protein [Bacillus wiedmannii]